MSQLVDFYTGEGTDSEGRRMAAIWGWDDDLEAVHDFIQWLFPLPEPSNFNPDAPLLSDDDIRAFRADALLQANLARSFERILAFLGLTRTAEGKVAEADNFAARAREVWAAPNHNWLRVTRILRSLSLLGQSEKARAFYGWLAELYQSGRAPIPGNTFRYWTAAVEGRS
ncbi:MAG: hypothetical protein L0Z62_11140 [Gemmataceae bacterium]|nr:hypothetical protein [Gemmataceae bacterium]